MTVNAHVHVNPAVAAVLGFLTLLAAVVGVLFMAAVLVLYTVVYVALAGWNRLRRRPAVKPADDLPRS